MPVQELEAAALGIRLGDGARPQREREAARFLLRTGQYDAYMERLISSYNPAAAEAVMCRSTLSVGWDGRLYDCDFNQQLDLPTAPPLPRHIADFDAEALARRPIVTGQHCYGCTAGAGSSCGGEVAR